jgi:parvulin-like peptidyl-prolyl isomerase
MARRKVKKEVPLTRKQISRREKERRQRLIMIGVAAFVGSLIVGILAFGFYSEQVMKPASPVAVVNGVPITTATYQKRLLLDRMNLDAAISNLEFQRSMLDPDEDQFLVNLIDQQLSQFAMERAALNDESFLNALIQEELMRQAAEERGVSASSEEVDRQIEESFGYYREPPTPEPSPTAEPVTATPELSPTVALTATPVLTPTATPTPMTRERFGELYGDFLTRLEEATGMSEAEFRETIRLSLLHDQMQELIAQEVPTSELQIHARHILLETRAEAETLLRRLEEGEDFATLAEELSQDPGSAQQGGDLGWVPQGQMVPEFDEAAFSLSPGELSDVVESSFGFHIILVEERDEDRELEPATLEQKRREAFQIWLFDLEAKATIERYWSEEKVPAV